MNEAKVMEVLRSIEWVMEGGGITKSYCPSCYWEKSQGHCEDCKLAELLAEANKEARHPALVAIANTAQGLRRNADMLRVAHSDADYIPAYLLDPLCEVLDDLDALDKEDRRWKR